MVKIDIKFETDETKIKLDTITDEKLEEAYTYMIERLVDSGWFGTEQDAVDWCGDVVYDAIDYYLEKLGITLDIKEDL